jgi:hypothetical protein
MAEKVTEPIKVLTNLAQMERFSSELVKPKAKPVHYLLILVECPELGYKRNAIFGQSFPSN